MAEASSSSVAAVPAPETPVETSAIPAVEASSSSTKDQVAVQEDESDALPHKYIFHSRTYIEVGDLVIIYMTRDKMEAIHVTPGQVLHNKYGLYPHEAMVGVKFGSRITSPPPSPGFIHLLRPTPELWTLSLPHRTQILYQADISFIMEWLGVRPGSKVVEAGTGSGSMTHALGRTVRTEIGGGEVKGVKVKVEENVEEKKGKGKEQEVETESEEQLDVKRRSEGQVWSFEYHKTRFEKAQIEFNSHFSSCIPKSLSSSPIKLQHRNVCREGFSTSLILKETGGLGVDSVFLDLPAPWEAIPFATEVLRKDTVTKICCFSPCIEQVQRSVMALDEAGFTDITMFEVLSRVHELVTPTAITQFPTISSITSKLKTQAVKKERRRLIQMENAREKKRKDLEKAKADAEEEAVSAGAGVEAEDVDMDAGEGSSSVKRSLEDGEEGPSAKKVKIDATAEGSGSPSKTPNSKATLTSTTNGKSPASIAMPPPRFLGRTNGKLAMDGESEEDFDGEEEEQADEAETTEPWQLPQSSTAWSKPVAETRGHTSYLTFAVMYPKEVRDEIDRRFPVKEKEKKVDTPVPSDKPTPRVREASVTTTFRDGSFDLNDGIDDAIATMTEEELMSMGAM